MKKTITSTLFVLFFALSSTLLFAQEPGRFVIELSVQHNGETVVIEGVSSVSYSIQRYNNDIAAEMGEAPAYQAPSYYMSITLKELNKKIAKLMASKDIKFDGTIIFKDNYGKLPARELKFKNGMFNSASESFTAGDSYGDYGYASLSVECNSLSLDGVEIKQ